MEAVERGTHIQWNDADDVVTVFTCHRRVMTKMEKLGARVKDKCVLDGRVRRCEYEIDKSKINVILTAKRRATAHEIERLRQARVLSTYRQTEGAPKMTLQQRFQKRHNEKRIRTMEFNGGFSKDDAERAARESFPRKEVIVNELIKKEKEARIRTIEVSRQPKYPKMGTNKILGGKYEL
jgi:hypothetical protein